MTYWCPGIYFVTKYYVVVNVVKSVMKFRYNMHRRQLRFGNFEAGIEISLFHEH
jgi:hypothetical protein